MGLRMSEDEFKALMQRGNLRISQNSPRKKNVSQAEPEKETKPKKKGKTKDEPQSYAEEVYYNTIVQPLLMIGEITSCSMHESYEIIPAVKCGNVSFRTKIYTPDFVLKFKNGKTKIVEIKGSVVKKLQRDYPLRRQLFILNYCIPNDWEFEEVKAEELTKPKLS